MVILEFDLEPSLATRRRLHTERRCEMRSPARDMDVLLVSEWKEEEDVGRKTFQIGRERDRDINTSRAHSSGLLTLP